MAEILVQFAPKGDDEVLDAIKKVTRHVGDLKRIAKTPIDLQIAKNAMAPEDFNRLKTTINKAKDATTDWSKETTKLWKEQEKLAKTAERAAASAAKAAKMSPTITNGGLQFTGSMIGGGGKAPLLPLGANSSLSTLPNPKDFSPKAIDDLNKSLGNTPKKAQAAAQSLGFVGRIIAAMAVRTFIREVYDLTNAWTAFENKIKTVLTNQQDLGFVTKDLIGISQRSRMSLEAVGTIYTRTARAVQALGKSQIETAKFTETLSKAVAVGGSTSIEAKNAMIQLSQGLSSGTLKGDELRSVLEQLPIVAELIAKKMGVTVGQLRKLGSEGKLTTDVVFGAIVDATDKIEAQFAKMKPTLESVVQVIKDKFMVAIGQSSGTIDQVTKALSFLSDNFDIAFRAATALAGIMSLLATGKFAMWMVSGLANPWIALAAAIAAATVAYVAFSDKINASEDGILKISNIQNAWFQTIKQDLQALVTDIETTTSAFAKFIGLFSEDVKYSHSWDQMYDRLAKLTDLARTLSTTGGLTPGGLAGTFFRRLVGDESTTRTQDNLERERALALGAKKDADATHLEEVSRRFNAYKLSTTPEMNPQYMTPKSGDPKGKEKTGETFESLFEDAAFDESMSRLSETEAKIKTKVRSLLEKLKPSIRESMGDISKEIAKIENQFTADEYNKLEEWLINPSAKQKALRDKNGRIETLKKENALYTEQAKKLEEIVRAEITREKKRGSKEAGKTFEDLLKEATFQEDASKLGDIEEKVKQRLHRMLESLKPSIQKALQGEGSLSSAYREQAKALEELITAEIHREEKEKSMIERDKIIAKQTEEGIKKAKELAEARKKLIEETADRQTAKFDNMKSIASSISPNFAIQQQVIELEKFRDFARQNHLSDWAKQATKSIEELKASMRWENTHFETFAGQMNSIFGPGGTLVKGFADAAANAIVMSESLGDLRKALVDVLNSVQKQALSSLIQLPLNLALGALTNSITGGGGPSSFTAGTGGARSVSAAEASSWQLGAKKFASGGFTGYGSPQAAAGIVHGQEYVLNADATRRMGKQNLDLINKGATPSASSAPANITINNNAGVHVEARELSPGEVEVMITKAIRDQTGRVVAGMINDPNSPVSRSMQKNLDTGRRRV